MGTEGSGMYVGVVDGTTPFGNVTKWGLTNLFNTPPTVAADTNRHSLTTDVSWPTNYINEFFKTASSPQGHGFNLANTGEPGRLLYIRAADQRADQDDRARRHLQVEPTGPSHHVLWWWLG